MRIIGGVFVLIIVLFVISLVRKERIREKYALLWIGLGAITLVLSLFPQLLFWASDLLGVAVPSNLLFALTFVLLIAVCLHLTWELSRTQDKTRRLAEEVAILRMQMTEQQDEKQ